MSKPYGGTGELLHAREGGGVSGSKGGNKPFSLSASATQKLAKNQPIRAKSSDALDCVAHTSFKWNFFLTRAQHTRVSTSVSKSHFFARFFFCFFCQKDKKMQKRKEKSVLAPVPFLFRVCGAEDGQEARARRPKTTSSS